MKIGERGQVTIPKRYRERYGLMPSTDVEFCEINGELALRKKTEAGKTRRRKSIEASIGVLKGRPQNVDQFIEDIRGR